MHLIKRKMPCCKEEFSLYGIIVPSTLMENLKYNIFDINLKTGGQVMQVEILPGCISCGACESINGEVFILNTLAHVIDENITGNEDDCRIAAEACPVNVIKIMEED